jgi:hypothetical protein
MMKCFDAFVIGQWSLEPSVFEVLNVESPILVRVAALIREYIIDDILDLKNGHGRQQPIS